ncbi:MAG TPA: LysM domain-containing protein, partial [Bacteroidales bacterium]|nr:LysM domain-containing protein [Bacteroidales bacterium]
YELREFNDVTDFKLEPCEGEAVYLHYKQKKSKVQFHIVKDGESVRGISQRYAIKLKTLYKNNIKKGIMLHLLRPGDRICITCK